MSDKRVSEMTDTEIQELAGAARPVTYFDASRTDRSWLEARDRYDELSGRDMSARSRAILVARGEFDPEEHGTADPAPLTLSEHLEVLANGEVVARVYRHPVQVDHAVKAGATWEQIAEATGTSEARARQEYREWAEGQHNLWRDYEGKFGMDDAGYTAAITRAGAPGPGARPAGPVRVQVPDSGVMATYADRAERAASLRLAEARQVIAGRTGYVPAWAELGEGERERATLEARNWLRAAAAAGLAVPGVADPHGPEDVLRPPRAAWAAGPAPESSGTGQAGS